MKRILFALVSISAFSGLSESKAQINNFVNTTSYGRVSPIVRIRGAMGFVVKKNLVVTVATDPMENGNMVEERVSFDTISVPMPMSRFDSVAKIVKVDRFHHLALLSVDTRDVMPIPLALGSTDSEAVDRYMETKIPKKPSDLFRGAKMILASTTAVLGDDFRSIPGEPVLNARGEAVGMTIASCNARVKWEACSLPIQQLQQFISSAR